MRGKPYVLLLRGVMPMGKNKVPMARLREVLTAEGFSDVQTYIQSGNVLLRSDLSAPELEKLVHELITKKFGGDIVVVAKTPTQMRRIFSGNPFRNNDPASMYFSVLSEKPKAQKVRELSAEKFPPDTFYISSDVVYVYCPKRYGVSKLNNNFFEKRLGVSATTRNYNTMKRLTELGKSI